MPVETIQVAYINPPREGAKTGSIKDSEGRYFRVWPDKLDRYTQGGTYEIEYDVREWEGKTYRTVKRIISGGGGNSAGSASAVPKQNNLEEACRIAVTGLVGRCHEGTGNLPGEDVLAAQMQAVKNAFERVFLNKPRTPMPPPDMEGDEIPF